MGSHMDGVGLDAKGGGRMSVCFMHCRHCAVENCPMRIVDDVICDHYKAKHQTNADRIRQMSDEEFTVWIIKIQYREGDICAPVHDVQNCHYVDGCRTCWLDWLKREASEVGERE